MPSTVQFTVELEVDQVHEDLLTGRTAEATRVPHLARHLVSDDGTVRHSATLLTLLGEVGLRNTGILVGTN